MKIDAQLSYSKFRFDQDTDAHLVLSITAPVKDGEAARPPICIVPVIDVSGSMSGEKLDYAKRSAIKLIEHLKVGDYCGLIAFDSHVRTVSPVQKLTAEGKEKIKAEIGKLRTGGSTNFSGGLLTALEALEKLDLPAEVLQRVVMFTDGHANAGIAQKPPEIIRLLTNAGRATVSAFGYGSDTDQQFLLDFAKEGKGNYAFIQDPDGALSAFGKELGGLLSTYATNLDVILDPLAGHEIVQVVSDVEAEQEAIGGNVNVKIPDILGEETRHIVLAVKLKAQNNAGPRAVNVFDVKLGFDVVDALGKKERKTLEVKAKAQFVKHGEQDKAPSPRLDEIIALAQLVRAQIEAEEAAKKGQFEVAQAMMKTAGAAIRRRGCVRVADVADGIGARLGDQHVYAANQGYLRSMQQGVTRGVGGSGYAVDAADDLGVLGLSLSNSAQESFTKSFTAPAESVPSAAPVPDLSDLWSGMAPGTFTVTDTGPDLGSLLMGTAEPVPEPAKAPEPAKTKPIRQGKSSRW